MCKTKKLQRDKPILDDGDANSGWIHIDQRHITGNSAKGAGDLFAEGTTREQIEKAANKIIKKGHRTTKNPSQVLQTFEMKIVINKKKDLVKLVVDTSNSNRIITMYPVRGGK